MKTYHLLIVAGSCITRESRFYKVAVGSSQKDIRCCRFLTDNSAAQGHYFQQWCADTCIFLEKIAKSLSVGLHDLQVMRIDISELVSCIKTHRDTPKIPAMSRTAAYARQIIDPAFYFQRQLNVIRKAEAKQRNKPKAKCVSTQGNISPLKDTPSADGNL